VKNVTVKNKVCNAQIWDTGTLSLTLLPFVFLTCLAGQERFKALTSTYYRGCQGAFLVYDITNHNSFVNVETWLEEIRRVAPADVGMICSFLFLFLFILFIYLFFSFISVRFVFLWIFV
jgi:hypothetical protein